jgi:ribonuclease HI
VGIYLLSFSMQISVSTDGGSRGNPGISGIGVIISDEQSRIIHKISKFIGIKTNNEAEYSALLEALTWVRDHQAEFVQVKFYSDSQLLVRQINGKYKVKAANIKPLYQLAISVLSDIHIPCSFHEILREKNSLADELANLAMDKKS